VSSPDDPTAAHCVRCGQALEPGARFCPNCGLRVGADGVAEEPDETVVMPASPVATGGLRDDPVETVTYAMPEERPWPWGWILGILAALVALLILAVIVQELDDDDEQAPETTSTTSAPRTSTSASESTQRSVATTEPRPAATEPPPQQTEQPTEPPAPDPTEPPVTQQPDPTILSGQ
jgi:hypothetical protein